MSDEQMIKKNFIHHFDGADVIITGALGFIGSYTLAKILHAIPNSGTLFVLIRGKNTQTAQDRFDALVAKHTNLFENVDLNRVRVVDVDCTNLTQISVELILELNAVKAFIHIAASVEWTLSYEDAMKANDVTQIYLWAREHLPHLKAFVQTSTAYSSPMHVSMIQECFDPDYETNKLDRESFANSYTWSKYVAEHELRKLVLKESESICRVGIVRPGIVSGALGTDAFAGSGWNMNMNTVNGSFLVYGGWGKNLTRLTPVNKKASCNITPVDLVANVLLLSTAQLMGDAIEKAADVEIVNCVQAQENTTTWGDFMKIFSPNPNELIFVKSQKQFDRLFKLFVEIPCRFIPYGKYKAQKLRSGLEIMLVFTVPNYLFKTDQLRKLDRESSVFEKRMFPVYFHGFDYTSYVTNCFNYAVKHLLRTRKQIVESINRRKQEAKLNAAPTPAESGGARVLSAATA